MWAITTAIGTGCGVSSSENDATYPHRRQPIERCGALVEGLDLAPGQEYHRLQENTPYAIGADDRRGLDVGRVIADEVFDGRGHVFVVRGVRHIGQHQCAFLAGHSDEIVRLRQNGGRLRRLRL